jgi:hypothetical protein
MATIPDCDPRADYVLIDYENMQPADLELLVKHKCGAKIFLGAPQAKINYETVAVLQEMGIAAEYIRAEGIGNNTVDFHIAFYAGQLAAAHPHARIWIISHDRGFDPMIRHLHKRNVGCYRTVAIKDIPFVLSTDDVVVERARIIRKNFAARNGRPRTRLSLRRTIRSRFDNKIDNLEADRVISLLEGEGFVREEGEWMVYADAARTTNRENADSIHANAAKAAHSPA